MANPILFGSSIFSTIIHYIGLLKFKPNNYLMEYSYISGLLTSIINHGMSHIFFKILDRITITILFFINIYLLNKIYKITKNRYIIENCFFIMILSVIMFLITKILNIKNEKNIKYIPHLLSHILITITNLILMHEYNKVKLRN